MTDKTKTCLAVVLYVAMFVLPIVSLAIGWIGWGFRPGAIAALTTFAVCFLLASLFLAAVNDLSWMFVALPFTMAVLYTVLPDFLVGPFDDGIVLSAGALMTFGLWVRKQPDTPKWIVLPLIAAGVYTFLAGGVIPGPVDELVVAIIGTGIAAGGSALNRRRQNDELQVSEDPDVIDAEFTIQDK